MDIVLLISSGQSIKAHIPRDEILGNIGKYLKTQNDVCVYFVRINNIKFDINIFKSTRLTKLGVHDDMHIYVSLINDDTQTIPFLDNSISSICDSLNNFHIETNNNLEDKYFMSDEDNNCYMSDDEYYLSDNDNKKENLYVSDENNEIDEDVIDEKNIKTIIKIFGKENIDNITQTYISCKRNIDKTIETLNVDS